MKEAIKNFRISFLFIFLFVTGISGYAVDEAHHDTTSLKIRSYETEKIERFKDQQDFDYKREYTKSGNRIFDWINYLLDKLFGLALNKDTAKIWEVIFYIIAGAALIFFVLKAFKTDFQSVFFSRKKSKLRFTEIKEDIHEMDLDKLLKEALESKQYRRSVRLFYLIALKELSDRQYIHWKIDKTNQDYITELEKSSYLNDFRSITYVFEYIWYGDFTVDDSSFVQVRSSFENFIKRVKGGR